MRLGRKPFATSICWSLKGGDPSAGSPTDTLLQLSPPRGILNRLPSKRTASSKPHSAGLMGGVCKTQGLIHRAIVTRDYWGFHLHEGGLQPSIRTEDKFLGLPYPFGLETHCLVHCMPRVAQEIRAIQIYRGPLLPQCYHCSFHRVLIGKSRDSNYGHGSRPLPELTGRFIVRADDDHTTPLSVSGKPFRLTIMLLSPLVSFLALCPIKPQHPPLVVRPRQFR